MENFIIMKNDRKINGQLHADKLLKDCLRSCLTAVKDNKSIDFSKLTSEDIEKDRVSHCQYVL